MTVFVDVVGRGPNLTLLHGWGLNGAVWNGLRDPLARDFTLHIIDLPGHGRSHGAPVSSLDAMVDAIVHAMPQQSHLLGWSLGGHAALALAVVTRSGSASW
jgi:pimeloyl-[acyl-carrier protein] methyl ester esterase